MSDDAPAAVDVDPAELERLNPKVQLLWLARVAVAAAVLAALAAGGAFVLEAPLVEVAAGAFALGLLVGVPHTLLRYRVWGFVLREDSLYLQRGVLVRVQTVVPYVRIQHVDTRRSPFERTLGLASSVVYTAGSRGADVQIPGLKRDRARRLQERLKDLANVSGRDDAV
ncbi:MAG: PH domain-containing protein [Halobacteriales archaeon]